ncbi:TRAP transporter large permease [Bacillus sp. Marseille-P3661]|uniref:TRAP transporter large permease n=1 Tax=Bacillus sp. Marseille-P3661 TaxID=1936234 RepID=UPI0015E1A971|nr:TRAP transporter large permease [Bacillus sp. Marseille-P3661]
MEWLVFLIFVVFLILRVPVAFALAISSLIMFYVQDFNLITVTQKIYNGLDSTTLMAIPGFIFAGIIMTRGGIAKYLIEFLKSWVGHISGGMAVVTILACMIFAAISGSSPATAAAIGSIMIPGMMNAGYSKKYAMGLVAAGGTLGILIPPSLSFILYGAVTGTSIGDLFIAGILPGIFLGLVLITSAIIYARKNNFGKLPQASWSERKAASIKAIPGGLLPFIIFYTIYGGIATPTESAVIACVYGLIVSIFIYKEIKIKDIKPVLVETVQLTSMIFMIIAAAIIFGLYLTNNQIPQAIASWIIDSNFNKWMFLAMVNILLFILGTFLEGVAIILITMPLFFPILGQLGINPIHFAVIIVVNLELAMITPPVGLNLFVVSGVAKEKLENVIKAIVPYIFLMIAVLIIIIVWPELSLMLVE